MVEAKRVLMGVIGATDPLDYVTAIGAALHQLDRNERYLMDIERRTQLAALRGSYKGGTG